MMGPRADMCAGEGESVGEPLEVLSSPTSAPSEEPENEGGAVALWFVLSFSDGGDSSLPKPASSTPPFLVPGGVLALKEAVVQKAYPQAKKLSLNSSSSRKQQQAPTSMKTLRALSVKEVVVGTPKMDAVAAGVSKAGSATTKQPNHWMQGLLAAKEAIVHKAYPYAAVKSSSKQ
jgi:hypothetical protein